MQIWSQIPMNQTTRSRNISATSEDNNNYTPLRSGARAAAAGGGAIRRASSAHNDANASTTIQCHKHLILINNQQLSPTSNTTRFIYTIKWKNNFWSSIEIKVTFPMIFSHGKTKIQGKIRHSGRAPPAATYNTRPAALLYTYEQGGPPSPLRS